MEYLFIQMSDSQVLSRHACWPAGLVTLMAVKAFGADAVAIADIKRDNLDLAMKLGADVALNPDRDAAPQEVATWMRAALPPHGPDMVIDCAGFEPTLQVSCSFFAAHIMEAVRLSTGPWKHDAVAHSSSRAPVHSQDASLGTDADLQYT